MRFAIFSSMGNTTWNDVATLWRQRKDPSYFVRRQLPPTARSAKA